MSKTLTVTIAADPAPALSSLQDVDWAMTRLVVRQYEQTGLPDDGQGVPTPRKPMPGYWLSFAECMRRIEQVAKTPIAGTGYDRTLKEAAEIDAAMRRNRSIGASTAIDKGSWLRPVEQLDRAYSKAVEERWP